MISTVFITGSAKRIGAVIARKLAMSGSRVLLHANHSENDVAGLCGSLRRAGFWAEYVIGDLSVPDEVPALFERAVGKAGQIDALINNASCFGHLPFLSETPVSIEYFWRVNAMAPMLLTQALAKHLSARGARGAVVNLLDQRITHPTVGALAYQVSKQALEAFTYSGAKELAPLLRINAVAPGAVLTPDRPEGKEPAGDFLSVQPPCPDEIADAVLFLLRSPGVIGQTIFVDGGQHL